MCLKKIKALNLLVKEKKVELKKIVKACIYYSGKQVAIVDIFNDSLSDNEVNISTEDIPHYLGEDTYTVGSPKSIEKYNHLIEVGRIFLTNIRLEAKKALKEKENK